MIIEVGKKYQDLRIKEWTIELIAGTTDGRFVALYPSGNQTFVSRNLIESLYKPFEEEQCVS